MTREEWHAFEIPVAMAFFVKRSVNGTVAAFYPSPAGAVETTVPEGAWEAIIRRYPGLAGLRPDVEAFLLRRGDSEDDAFIAPLDQCYRLIGIIRREWQGFTGGDAVRQAVDRFFLDLGDTSGGLS